MPYFPSYGPPQASQPGAAQPTDPLSQLAAAKNNAVLRQQYNNMGLGSLAMDPAGMGRSQMRYDQSNAERIAQQQNNFQYGGFAGGADAAVAATRNRIDPYAQNLGDMGMSMLGGVTQGANNMQLGTYGQFGAAGDLMNYANQGPGASVAQAQLQANTAQAMRQQLAMAGSGRGAGGGAAAFRQAADNQAQIQGQANAQAAMLQAQEAQNWRQAQLQAMGQAGQLYGQGAGTGAEYATNMGGLAMQGQQGAGQLTLGQEGLVGDIYKADLAGRSQYEQNLTDIYGISTGVPKTPDEGNPLMQGLFTVGGGAVGAYFGGPAGAVAGAQLGNWAGSQF